MNRCLGSLVRCAHTARRDWFVTFAMSLLLFAGSAAAQITVTSGSTFATAEGSAGRLGSTTGPLLDQPGNVTGTSGLVFNEAHIAGGPVPPGDPKSLFPGTTCEVFAGCVSSIEFNGGASFMYIYSRGNTQNGLINMDGTGLSAVAAASGNTDYYFTISTPMP